MARLDAWLRAWGPFLLLGFAFIYYAQYYRSGLNLGGEGGTVAVNAMRLNEGWLPIKDTTLNYNLLWFYPVAWLFDVTGPSYVALRIYFFALCTISGLLGFWIVRRVTGRGWMALATGLVILAIPGMMFRNYMGLLPLLNAWALLQAFVWPAQKGWRRWAWFAVAGWALGLTYLVRVDVGVFFTVIYGGVAALYSLGVRGEFLRRLPVAVGGALVLLLAALAIHAPFYADAQRRGFGPEFTNQYTTIWNLIVYEAGKRLPARSPASKSKPKASPPSTTMQPVAAPEYLPVRFKRTPKNWAQLATAERIKREEADRHGRPRQELHDLFEAGSFYQAAFILALYLPILVAGVIFAGAGAALAWALGVRDAAGKEAALVCLVTLGAALTLFPQYFFFRPDTPHLSEFMIPFLVAMVCASFYAWRGAARARSWLVWVPAGGFVALCAFTESVFFYHSFPKESAGTIAANRKRHFEVMADNGVRVLVKRGEQARFQGLHDTIVRYSGPNDWVITYPYSPTINFMTNRRSYLKNLYIDNATAPRDFLRQTQAEIERYQPAVIVIDHRDINDTEFSRFRNWAAPTYEFIRHRYKLAGTFGENEVYVRSDKFPPQT